MLVVWGLPYAVAGFYDFLRGEWFPPWRALSELLPNWLPPVWFIAGLIAFLLVTIEGAYRIVQNERNKYPLRKRIPLTNRETLIRIIGVIQQKVIELRMIQDDIDRKLKNYKDPREELIKQSDILTSYSSAMKKLENERLIVSEEYREIIDKLRCYVEISVNDFISQKPEILKELPFRAQLRHNVEQAIRELDELNQQALDKEGSQN